jgi:putative transposase
LSDHLCASGPVAALEMAIEGCSDTTGLIHHSDRGVQYCSNDYVGVLQKHQIGISMTQSGDPRENAIAERVNGILKKEVLRQDVFNDLAEAKAAIAEAVDTYNYLRPHSSVAMLTPALAHRANGGLKQCWKNYYKSKPRIEIMDG